MKTDHSTTTATEARTELETETRSKTELDHPATVAECTIQAADFALGDTLAALDGVTFEIERVVAHGGECFVSLVWVRGSDSVSLEQVLNDDPSVVGFELFADVGDEDEAECEYLYRMEWSERTGGFIHLLTEENSTILAAATANGQWNLRLLVPEREALSRTHEACEAAGFTMGFTGIYALNDGRQGRFGLTDEQQEALILAFEHGYYEVPRDTRAQEFAEALGISHQALSERLRRAHSNLVENAIVSGFE